MSETTRRGTDPSGFRPEPGRDRLPDIDDGPLIPDDDTLKCLGAVELRSFAADSVTVDPFGRGTTLRWNVSVPSDCTVGLRLNGSSVGRSGSLDVQPAVTTRYTLTASARRATRALGTVEVRVDMSACREVEVSEGQVRTTLRNTISQFLQSDESVTQRADPRIEVTSRGLEVALRLKKKINNFPDPKVDIDFTLGLRVRNGEADAFYRSFSVDVDWPWGVTIITAGVSKIVEEFIDGKIEKRLKPLILQKVQEQIGQFVDAIPGDLRLHSLRTVENLVSLTLCPAGPETPFIVVTPVGGILDQVVRDV